jgi:hypothetical protein
VAAAGSTIARNQFTAFSGMASGNPCRRSRELAEVSFPPGQASSRVPASDRSRTVAVLQLALVSEFLMRCLLCIAYKFVGSSAGFLISSVISCVISISVGPMDCIEDHRFVPLIVCGVTQPPMLKLCLGGSEALCERNLDNLINR